MKKLLITFFILISSLASAQSGWTYIYNWPNPYNVLIVTPTPTHTGSPSATPTPTGSATPTPVFTATPVTVTVSNLTPQNTQIPIPTQIPLNPTPNGGPIGISYAASPTPGINTNSYILNVPATPVGGPWGIAYAASPTPGTNVNAFIWNLTPQFTPIAQFTQIPAVATPIGGFIGQSYAASPTPGINVNAFIWNQATPNATIQSNASNQLTQVAIANLALTPWPTQQIYFNNISQPVFQTTPTAVNTPQGTSPTFTPTFSPTPVNVHDTDSVHGERFVATGTITPYPVVENITPIITGGVTLLSTLPAFGSTPIVTGGVTLLSTLPAYGATPIITGGVTLLSTLPAFGATPIITGGTTVVGTLPAGTNTIGGVSLIGPLAAGSNAIGGVSELAPVTVAYMQTPVMNYYVSNNASVSATGMAVTVGGTTYLLTRFQMGVTSIGGSGAVDYVYYENFNPLTNQFVTVSGPQTLSGSGAITFLAIPTPGFAIAVSVTATSGATVKFGGVGTQ